jgi:release factor glutamine methyltransferase
MMEVVERLRAAGVPTPEADARWLLALDVTDGEREELVRRREAREPLQLLLGRWPFRDIELALEPGVFIPRPETEVVAGVAIDAARAARTVVDLCTGSGAIAAAVADETTVRRIVATDVSQGAVKLARRNTAPWSDRVEVRHGDLLEPLADLVGTIDVLVANPPYLPPEAFPLEVQHDPHDALVAGPDGHEFVNAILSAAPAVLVPGGTVIVEIDDRRGPEAAGHARSAGLADVSIITDLAGRDRAVRGSSRG